MQRSFMVMIYLVVELLAQSGSTKRNGSRKASQSKVPKPTGAAGDDYSIIEEMGLKDKKGEFKSIQVSNETLRGGNIS
jgi:hypothetical protein